MKEPSTQELKIVQAFSALEVPERIIRESNVKELIKGMASEQESVQSDAQRLERLRREQKDGNFIGNWWHDRDDKVQDAQLDLNQSIGRLTQKSSQLLVVNTAISKVLSDQQRVLLRQQELLQQQADELAGQNRKIFEQQQLLEQQQRDINAANQGLMEAKGVTQEQAQKLVGCVVRVTEAEQKIDDANRALRAEVDRRLSDGLAQNLERLDVGLAAADRRQAESEQRLAEAFALQTAHIRDELERYGAASTDFTAGLEQRLQDHVRAATERAAAQDAALSQARAVLAEQLAAAGAEQARALDARCESQARGLEDLAMQLNETAAALQQAQRQSARRAGLVAALSLAVALAALGWQAALRFAS